MTEPSELSDGLVPARGEKRGPVDFHRSQNSNLGGGGGGGEEPDSVFSLGHTVGRYFTRQQLTHGVADHGGKLQAINIQQQQPSEASAPKDVDNVTQVEFIRKCTWEHREVISLESLQI